MNSILDLFSVKCFLAAAKHLNFSKAAQELYISQPTLSKQIQSLEHSTGLQLFHRNNRSIALTNEGFSLYYDLSNLLAQTEFSISRASTIAQTNLKPIRIGISEYFSPYISMPFLQKKLNETFPEYYLQYYQLTSDELKIQNKKRIFDFLFLTEKEIPFYKNAAYRDAVPFDPCLYFANSHPLAQNPDHVLENCTKYTFACLGTAYWMNSFNALIKANLPGIELSDISIRLVNRIDDISDAILHKQLISIGPRKWKGRTLCSNYPLQNKACHYDGYILWNPARIAYPEDHESLLSFLLDEVNA